MQRFLFVVMAMVVTPNIARADEPVIEVEDSGEQSPEHITAELNELRAMIGRARSGGVSQSTIDEILRRIAQLEQRPAPTPGAPFDPSALLARIAELERKLAERPAAGTPGAPGAPGRDGKDAGVIQIGPTASGGIVVGPEYDLDTGVRGRTISSPEFNAGLVVRIGGTPGIRPFAQADGGYIRGIQSEEDTYGGYFLAGGGYYVGKGVGIGALIGGQTRYIGVVDGRHAGDVWGFMVKPIATFDIIGEKSDEGVQLVPYVGLGVGILPYGQALVIDRPDKVTAFTPDMTLGLRFR